MVNNQWEEDTWLYDAINPNIFQGVYKAWKERERGHFHSSFLPISSSISLLLPVFFRELPSKGLGFDFLSIFMK